MLPMIRMDPVEIVGDSPTVSDLFNQAYRATKILDYLNTRPRSPA